MSAEEPTAGGETIGISPLCLYPRDLSKADVDKVLNNKLSVEKMVEKGPKVSYMATKGYLCFAAFQEANQNCNPLTGKSAFVLFYHVILCVCMKYLRSECFIWP